MVPAAHVYGKKREIFFYAALLRNKGEGRLTALMNLGAKRAAVFVGWFGVSRHFRW